MSADIDPDLRTFLDSLGSSVGDDLRQFHEPFLSVDPNTVTAVGREQLRAALPMRARLFASIGASGTRLRDVSVIPLHDKHALATATWDVEFTDPEAESLQLRSTFLLRQVERRWEVLVYLNHQDIVRIVNERSRQLTAS